MKPGYLQTVFENDEDKHTASILFRIIFAMLATYLVAVVMAVLWRDLNLAGLTLAGSGLLIVPLVLLARGHLRASGLIVVLSVLGTVTVLATIGQGIHDVAIIAYPGIIVITSLITQRRDFFLLSLLAICAMGWLALDEAFGLFVSLPVESHTRTDFIIVEAIFLATVVAVNLLTENMQRNLHQAQQEISRRKTMETQLRHQSIHDALTGIYNRAFFEEELARLENSQEFPVSIIIADADGLKIVNDARGHAAGDELLRHAASVLQSTFRAVDVLARIGGDEFGILLPNTDSVTVEQIVSRVRERLTEHNLQYPALLVQLSLGAATAEQSNLTGAFTVADLRMYADKSARQANANHSSAA